MDAEYDFGPEEPGRLVYVRPVDVNDLPEEMQEAVEGETELYAVCNEDGEQLALVKDRKLAFILARQNDYAPVSVH